MASEDAQVVGAKQDAPTASTSAAGTNIEYRQYKDENDLWLLKTMIDAELVEPYSVFTFRMFVRPWPQLCHFCYIDGKPVGVVVCKIDQHKSGRRRGYLGMIVVLHEHRKRGIGRKLARLAIEAMDAEQVDEIVLECETHNVTAQRLYQSLGFVRDKMLPRYYFTGTNAYRLKLRLRASALASLQPTDDADSDAADTAADGSPASILVPEG